MIMYRTVELRSHQYYVNPTWSGMFVSSFLLWCITTVMWILGGLYASPGLSGSR